MLQGGMSVPAYAYAANNPIMFVDPNGLAPIRNVTDLLLRYQQLRVSYANWYANTLRPTTFWGQELYARNWAFGLFGQPYTILPGSRGDPACGGAAASLAEHLRSNVDTEGVRVEEITAAWTIGSSGHTTVQIDMSSADGFSSMHIGLDPFNAGAFPHGFEAGPSTFTLGPVRVQAPPTWTFP
jgi:hypothetical protein